MHDIEGHRLRLSKLLCVFSFSSQIFHCIQLPLPVNATFSLQPNDDTSSLETTAQQIAGTQKPGVLILWSFENLSY